MRELKPTYRERGTYSSKTFNRAAKFLSDADRNWIKEIAEENKLLTDNALNLVKDSNRKELEYSDVILAIDWEMERLGLTNSDGKNYIEKTYGKKSRQLLSDRELWEFLNYLKSQKLVEKVAC